MMKYQIRSLGYDPESDELDLLINSDAPQPAEAIALGHGVYIRRAFENGEIVGAMIRGYEQFAREVGSKNIVASENLSPKELSEIFEAIVQWQGEVGLLSHQLAEHLEAWPPQDSFLQVLVKS